MASPGIQAYASVVAGWNEIVGGGEGRCPACAEPGFTVKRLASGKLEEFCEHGCKPAEIRDVVRAELLARRDERLPKNGAAPGRQSPARTGQKRPAPEVSASKEKQSAGERVLPPGYTAAGILRMVIQAARFAVRGFICEGLNILAGGQKLGKSWMALGLGIAVATGGVAFGEVEVEQGDVLYLCLEDGLRRLRDRLLLVLQGEPAPERLVFWPDCAPASAGGILLIEDWLNEHPRARLVMIDTLARFRGAKPPAGDIYQQDYDFGARLKRLADEHHVAILLLHHLSKRQCDDPFDQVSGTIGVTASADATLLLKRKRGKDEAQLFVTGRDVEERELGLAWSKETCSWTLEGELADVRRSPERQEIIAWLKQHGANKPQTVADALGKNRSTTKVLMWKMAEAEELAHDGGLYWVSAKSNSQGA